MIQGLYTVASGSSAYLDKLDVLANNLANVDTPGFKADIVTIDPAAAPAGGSGGPSGRATAVKLGRFGLDPSPGMLHPTGNPLDLAIVGPGLFVVQTPQGERYTRAGTFQRDAQGYLATSDGFRVLGTTGPVSIPEGGLRLDARGRTAEGATLRIVAGPDAPGLRKAGANLYALDEGATRPPDLPTPTVVQGQLESSNVNVVRGMVEILACLRTYESQQRTAQAFDQTANMATNELGKV